MTGLNNVYAIFLFGTVLGLIFATEPSLGSFLSGFVGLILGCVYGRIAGILLALLPSNKSSHKDALKFTLTVMGGLFTVLGGQYLGFPSGGAVGCVTLALTLGSIWRWTGDNNNVENYLDIFWEFMKPISFALIGMVLDFSEMNGSIVGYGVLIIIIGVIFRTFFTYVSTTGGDYVWQERAFITLSSCPKATVQATIGAIALDLARQKESETDIDHANKVLNCSVLAILMTAPLAAFFMEKLAPKWLKSNRECGVENSAYM